MAINTSLRVYFMQCHQAIDDYVSGAVLSPSDSSTLVVIFSPTTEGVFTDTLIISSDDPDTPSLSITVSGYAVHEASYSTGRSLLRNTIYDFVSNA